MSNPKSSFTQEVAQAEAVFNRPRIVRTRSSTFSAAPASGLVDTKAAAKFLNCSVSTLRRRKDEGQIPYYKHGNKVMFSLSDLQRFLALHRVEAADHLITFDQG